MLTQFLLFAFIGFGAQLVDGALGMAYRAFEGGKMLDAIKIFVVKKIGRRKLPSKQAKGLVPLGFAGGFFDDCLLIQIIVPNHNCKILKERRI